MKRALGIVRVSQVGGREGESFASPGEQADRINSTLTVNIAERWDDLTLAEQRAFIQGTVARAVVGPGKGASRISIELLREKSAGDTVG